MSSIFDPEREDRRAFHIGSIRKAPRLSARPTSRGSRLPHRLQRDVSRGCWVGVSWAAAILVSAIVGGLVFLLWHYAIRVETNEAWILISLGLAAILLAPLAIYSIVRTLRLTLSTRTPETVIELDHLDLVPGARVSVYVKQPGPARLNRFQITLKCIEAEAITLLWRELRIDEDGISRPHAHRSTESSETPHEWTLLDRESLIIDDRFPLEMTIDVTIPMEVLPSGRSSQTEEFSLESTPSFVPPEAEQVRRTVETTVSTSLIVVGDVEGRADFAHEFPIVIFPGETSEKKT